MTDLEIYKKILELKAGGSAVCLATIVETSGSTPRQTGAKMILCVDGTSYGTIGGGCGENQVRSAALRSTLVTGQPHIVEVDLTDDIGTKGGDVCGGKLRVFIEPL